MPEREYLPRTDAGREGLAAVRRDLAGALVGVDFDGTLSRIVDDPADARPVAGATEVLDALARHVGTVVVVTGRPADVAAERIGVDGDVLVLGHYGDERWTASTGVQVATPPPPGLDDARAALPDVLSALGDPDGVRIEDKGTSLAVHVRAAAEPHGLFVRLAAPLHELAERTGLSVQPGRFVHELRGHTSDKGTALRALVVERGPSSVVFAGDDLGDLAAFEVVERLRAEEGVPGLTVASLGPEPVPDVTDRADLVLNGPDAVVAFLRHLIPPS